MLAKRDNKPLPIFVQQLLAYIDAHYHGTNAN
jgi:hypothetical protein